MLYGYTSSRCRRINVPEASTRKQTQYTRCTSRNLEKACAIFRQVPCIASLSDMIVTSVCSSKGGPRTGLCCTGSTSCRCRRTSVPEASTRKQTQYLHHTCCTSRNLEKACAILRQVPCAAQEKVDDLLSDGKMSCRLKEGRRPRGPCPRRMFARSTAKKIHGPPASLAALSKRSTDSAVAKQLHDRT